MKTDNSRTQQNQKVNNHDAEIAIFQGVLAEIYYLLTDRSSRAVRDVMFLIEGIIPKVKNYKSPS